MFLNLIVSLGLLISAFILTFGICVVFVGYPTHKTMVEKYTNKYGKANYNIFIQEFNKCKWDTERFKGSLFDEATDSEIHASIIMFNGVGMVMKNPIEYLKVSFYIKQYINKHQKCKESAMSYVWKEEAR